MDAVRVEDRARELLKSDFKCAESVLQAFAERGMPEKCLGFSVFAAGTAARIANGP